MSKPPSIGLITRSVMATLNALRRDQPFNVHFGLTHVLANVATSYTVSAFPTALWQYEDHR